MLKKIIFSITLIIFLLIVLSTIQNRDLKLFKIKNNSSSPHSEEEPFAYLKYEHKRLRDPETGKIPEHNRRKELEFAKSLSLQKRSVGRAFQYQNDEMTFQWKKRGPFNIGGRTRALAIDIKDENNLIAGCVSGGIWKSKDGGNSWYKVSQPGQIQSITYVVQDTREGHEQTWYCCTGEIVGGSDQARDLVPYRGDGIFKSTDNGETWQLLVSTSTGIKSSSDTPFDWCWKVLVDRSNDEQEEVYAATYRGIYRSLDGGATWQMVLGAAVPVWLTDIEISSEGHIYASLSIGTKRGIWKSVNGTNWEQITPSLLPSHYERILIATAPSNENITYFLVDTTDIVNFDWTSDPNGPRTGQMLLVYKKSENQWDNRSQFLPSDYQSNISYCMSLDVHPQNEDVILLGGRMLYRSTDGFRSKSMTKKIGGHFYEFLGSHVDYHKIVFLNSNPNIAYSATDGGISKTKNVLGLNVSWEYKNNDYSTTQFYTSSIVPDLAFDQRIISGAHDHGIFYTDNSNLSGSWKYINYSDGSFTAFLNGGTVSIFNNHNSGSTFMTDRIPGDMYADAMCGQSYLARKYTFTRVNPTITNPLFVNPFVVDHKNGNVVYMAGGQNLYVCKNILDIELDKSQTTKDLYWITIAKINSGQISALTVTEQEPDILYFGTSLGKVFKITDPISSPLIKDITGTNVFPNQAYLSNIDIDPNNNDHVIISFSNYRIRSIFASWDGGQSWTHVTGNLEENSNGSGDGPSVNWVEILPTPEGNKYFAGTTTGLYSTTELNSNTVWLQEGAETIGNINVKHITTREVDGEVVISTYGNGIYSRDFDASDVSDHQKPIHGFELYQNYPNPFNPTTTINYSVINKSSKFHSKVYVNLKVFDILGREVTTLVNEEQAAGNYQVEFSARDLPSGTYIYQLTIENFSQTKKMIIQK